MPRLMEKKDWTRMVSGLGSLDRVWQEDVSGTSNVVSLSLPESGSYRVFIIKMDEEKNQASSDWRKIPVSSHVRRLVGIIPDEHPEMSYAEMISEAVAEHYGVAK